MDTVKIKAPCGAELEIDKMALDDMELLDALSALESGHAFAISRITELLLGEKNRKKLYDAIRENGRVPIASFQKEIEGILNALGSDGKK